MYVVLTSKPGQFRTELDGALKAIETWDYLFCGQLKAKFVIAQLAEEAKVRVVDETPPEVVNLVPTKFLPRFDSVEKARAELKTLAGGAGVEASLVRQGTA